jgi:hypothetical protein
MEKEIDSLRKREIIELVNNKYNILSSKRTITIIFYIISLLFFGLISFIIYKITQNYFLPLIFLITTYVLAAIVVIIILYKIDKLWICPQCNKKLVSTRGGLLYTDRCPNCGIIIK